MVNTLDKQIHANELKLRLLMMDGCNKKCSFCLNDFQAKLSIGQMQMLEPAIARKAIWQYAGSFKGKYPLQVYFSAENPPCTLICMV